MPRLDPKVAVHHLAVKKSIKPMKQEQRRFHPELVPSNETEVNKLIEASFVREVQYPTWLANIVLVRNKNGDKTPVEDVLRRIVAILIYTKPKVLKQRGRIPSTHPKVRGQAAGLSQPNDLKHPLYESQPREVPPPRREAERTSCNQPHCPPAKHPSPSRNSNPCHDSMSDTTGARSSSTHGRREKKVCSLEKLVEKPLPEIKAKVKKH
ncbi:hypothetical protein LIER_29907 [Lithospermum erythrorhizon]|uniref:Uncharacterized protein n=1 Tax=Lithospermum erythrorhizon TaxID=34254 RepID=A0AAV3RLW7_LITER